MKRKLTLWATVLLALWLAPAARAIEFDYTFGPNQTLHFESTSANVNYLAVSAATGGAVSGNLSIPGSFMSGDVTYYVTEIAYDGFSYCSGLTSVALPATIQTINGGAFEGCTALTSINIPESVTTIGSYAFEGCWQLSLLQVPLTVTSVGGNAFSSVPMVVWGNYDGVNSYGAEKIGAKIEDGLLYSDLAGTIVSGMLPEYTESVDIPEGVTTIAAYAFSGDTTIISVSLPGTLTTIQCGAFQGCTHLQSINIPASVTTIGVDVFAHTNISILTLSQGTAVNVCSDPNHHEHEQYNWEDDSYGYATFWGVKILVWPGSTGHYGAQRVCAAYEGGLLYEDEAKTILMGGDESVSNLVIPSTVSTVKAYAFLRHEGITELTIPNTVTFIGAGAFACPNLTTVHYNAAHITLSDNQSSMFNGIYYRYVAGYGYEEIPVSSPVSTLTIGDAVKYIPPYFLNGDSLLTELTLPESIDSIGERAFYGTGITELTIPEGMKRIGPAAFICPGLTTLHYNARSADVNGAFAHPYYNYTERLFSPISTLTLGDEVELIPDDFLVYDSLLTAVTLPESVRSIGDNAFKGTSIASIVIPEGVDTIGDEAFGTRTLTSVVYNATNAISWGQVFYSDEYGEDIIQTLTIGEGVQTLGQEIFSEMNIESVELPESLQSIGYGAFENCSHLTSITIPDNVTLIDEDAFRGCNQLVDITIGSGVTAIGEFAFYTPETSLTRHLTIGESVSYIGAGAFRGNRFDTIFMLPAVPPTIEATTFQSVPTNTRIVVPCNTLADYEDAPYWSDFTRMAEGASCGKVITVLSSDATMGTVSGGGSYPTGSVATIAAMPKMNYGFAGWADGSSDNPRLVMVSSDASYTANFTAMAGGIVHDTTIVTVHDTVHITVPVHDTLTVEVPVHDTLIVGDGDTLVVYIHDTTTVEVPVYDTVIVDNSTVDTLWLTDTVYITLTDTVYIHDTVYVPQDGIEDIHSISAKIYQHNGEIVVEGAEGNDVVLYDAVGRQLAMRRSDAEVVCFEAPVSGAYLVRIGNAPARRIVVVR